MVLNRSQNVSIKGKQYSIPALELGPNTRIIIRGTLLKIAEIHDEFWLHPKDIPPPNIMIEKLKGLPKIADLFKFGQKLPNIFPLYDYHFEMENIAAIKVYTYDYWLKNQINRKARQAVTRSKRKNVRTEVKPFTDELVNGICSIYNETPFRQGKVFWHYNKPFSVVKQENGTYLHNSLFIGAFLENELIGFAKLVLNGNVASLMQILSKIAHIDKNPTNALLAKAIEICEQNKAEYLTYGKYFYGNKFENSLVDFKRHNGFEKVDLPVYFVPLSLKGHMAVKVGLHKGLSSIIPAKLRMFYAKLRSNYYKWRNTLFEK